MEKKNGNGYCAPCCDGAMGALTATGSCGGHYGLLLLRWFLGLVIILMVFCLGVKIGYYKGIIESDYGYGGRMSQLKDYHKMMYGYGKYQDVVGRSSVVDEIAE